MKSTRLPTREEIDAKPETVRFLGTITAAMIQRYAVAVGDESPLYFDDAYARACGYLGIIAPPTFLAAVLGWEAGPAERELLSDGSDPALIIPETAGYKFMGGGQTLTFQEPVYAGDGITARKRVTDVYERQARSGALFFVVSETVYVNQQGTQLMHCRETLIARP
jgi:acyl dehydratase